MPETRSFLDASRYTFELMGKNRVLAVWTAPESEMAAESAIRSRRRHLHWFAASVASRSRLLRQRRGVVDRHIGDQLFGDTLESGPSYFAAEVVAFSKCRRYSYGSRIALAATRKAVPRCEKTAVGRDH